MAVESWPCRGGDRGEAAVRCCESMAVEIFYFLFFIFYFRFLAVCLGYENECEETNPKALIVVSEIGRDCLHGEWLTDKQK